MYIYILSLAVNRRKYVARTSSRVARCALFLACLFVRRLFPFDHEMTLLRAPMQSRWDVCRIAACQPADRPTDRSIGARSPRDEGESPRNGGDVGLHRHARVYARGNARSRETRGNNKSERTRNAKYIQEATTSALAPTRLKTAERIPRPPPFVRSIPASRTKSAVLYLGPSPPLCFPSCDSLPWTIPDVNIVGVSLDGDARTRDDGDRSNVFRKKEQEWFCIFPKERGEFWTGDYKKKKKKKSRGIERTSLREKIDGIRSRARSSLNRKQLISTRESRRAKMEWRYIKINGDGERVVYQFNSD